ncbi:protein unc-93 homolog A-like [Argiope bruennichi]|uniref:UNC93-like protein like n=1 Tax=Argiope bruennichi TaxID=94029 RepID=A0A8T0F9Y1_ARGBR|nr:protein unc-93 homolog A-like [Argiope bruennichi]KAF8786180.1 UNC93-like protein like [Argiope bruennichi]
MKVLYRHSSHAFELPTNKRAPSRHFSKLRIMKNIAVLGVGVHLLFFAYDGLSMLQSTMNREQGIGVISQATLYLCFCISAVLFPKYAIKKLGSKSTFAFSMLTYLPYVASNFYSHWALVIPTSILIGLGAALLWGSQATYLNDISLMYAELISNARDRKRQRNSGSERNSLSRRENVKSQSKRSLSCNPSYFVIYNNEANNLMLKLNKTTDAKRYSFPVAETPGAFTGADSINRCIEDDAAQENERMHYGSLDDVEKSSRYEHGEKGLAVASSIESSRQQLDMSERSKVIESTTARIFGFHGVTYLSSHVTSNLMTYYILQSEIPEGTKSNSSCVCGSDYCNVESLCFEQNIVAPSDQVRYILTTACVCVGFISVLIVFLLLDPLEEEKEEVSFSTDLLMATYKLGKRKELLLLIPLSLYIGMAQGFFTGDFNKSFVGCAWGTYHVGLVAICYGAVSGVSSFSSGWLVKRLGRIVIFVTATVVHLGANVFLLSWSPSADEPHMFFIAAGLWGMFVGVIWSQLRAFYGVLFKADEEAAFAAFHVWYSLGFSLSFACSNYICTGVKIYILLAICILGFLGYLSVEMLHLKNKVKD